MTDFPKDKFYSKLQKTGSPTCPSQNTTSDNCAVDIPRMNKATASASLKELVFGYLGIWVGENLHLAFT